MDWRERIPSDPDVLTGKPVIDGTRLSVEHVLELLENGWSEADILKSYPHLEPAGERASVRSAVKRVLRRNDVDGDDMQAVQEQIMEQAESLYADWPR